MELKTSFDVELKTSFDVESKTSFDVESKTSFGGTVASVFFHTIHLDWSIKPYDEIPSHFLFMIFVYPL